MLIYVKITKIKKKLFTDRRATQNYSSEPHNNEYNSENMRKCLNTGKDYNVSQHQMCLTFLKVKLVCFLL